MSKQVRLLLLGFIAATFTVICAMTLLVPAFMTNDDPVMLMIASGQLVSADPDEHLLYINVLVGIGLRWLYEHAPNVPWYSLYLYSHLCAAAALMLAACLRWHPPRLLYGLVWILTLGILVRFAVTPQFTVIAAWLAWASVAWCVSHCRPSAPRAHPWRAPVLAATVLALAGLMRPEAAALGAVMSLPLVAWALARDDGGAVPLMVSFGAGAMLLLLSAAVNNAYYGSSEEWNDFYAFNAAKGPFLDSASVQGGAATAEALDRVGWGPADLDMLRNWFYLDREVFTVEKLNSVSGAGNRRSAPESLSAAGDALGRIRRDPLATAAVSLTVLLLFVAPTTAGIWSMAAGFWFGIVSVAVALASRPMPTRVYWSCLAALVGTALVLACASKLEQLPRRVVVIALLLLAPPVLVEVRDNVRRSDRNALRMAGFKDDWRHLRERSPRLVVGWADAFPYELVVGPFAERRTPTVGTAFVGLGVLTPTAFTQQSIRVAGVDDLHLALIDDHRVVLVAREGQLPIFEEYLALRYGRRVQAVSQVEGQTLTTWQFLQRRAAALPDR